MAVYQHSVTGAVVSVADDYLMDSDWVPLDPAAPAEEPAEADEAPAEEPAEADEAPAEEPKQQSKTGTAAKKTAAK